MNDSVNTHTTPDKEARKHPLHAVIANVLRNANPLAPCERVWGRRDGDVDAGVEGNVWAGNPEDVADNIIQAITTRPSTDEREALTDPQLSILTEAAAYFETMLEDDDRNRDIATLNRAMSRVRAGFHRTPAPSDEDVERGARAVHAVANGWPRWSDMNDGDREQFRDFYRAAIAAMGGAK